MVFDWFSRLLNRATIDWPLLLSAICISLLGLVTMYSFTANDSFFARQTIWIVLSVLVALITSAIDLRFLKRTNTVVILYSSVVIALIAVLVVGKVIQGAQSWFDFGFFVVQPSDPAKLALIILLAKYFSRRHIEIANIRHVLVSGWYAGLIALLILLEPDFGSAVIVGGVWFGMMLLSGISKRHVFALLGIGFVGVVLIWTFVFQDYQKERIISFLHPLTDLQGAGYNAYQSTVAVGSGEWFGKGIGYGTQSKLQFLPEYQTDFIFAAFAEEWGFVGATMLVMLYGVVVWRLLRLALHSVSNFETLLACGVAILFLSHLTIHIGMNIGLLPVTGVTIPFMSYGGSHLMTEYFALGIVMALSRHSRGLHKGDSGHEILDSKEFERPLIS